MPLIINSLWGGSTNMQKTHTHIHTDVRIKTISKKPGARQPLAGVAGLTTKAVTIHYEQKRQSLVR